MHVKVSLCCASLIPRFRIQLAPALCKAHEQCLHTKILAGTKTELSICCNLCWPLNNLEVSVFDRPLVSAVNDVTETFQALVSSFCQRYFEHLWHDAVNSQCAQSIEAGLCASPSTHEGGPELENFRV